MNDKIIHVDEAGFEANVINSDIPVLLDFWAEWCGPCKAIAPTLDRIADDFNGRVRVAKMNVDENQSTPAKFGIRGIPALLLFKNGTVEAQSTGNVTHAQLAAFLEENL